MSLDRKFVTMYDFVSWELSAHIGEEIFRAHVSNSNNGCPES